MSSNGSGNSSLMNALRLGSTISVDFAICLFAGYWLGKHIGSWLGNPTLGVAVGVLIGLVTSIGISYVIVMKWMNDNE